MQRFQATGKLSKLGQRPFQVSVDFSTDGILVHVPDQDLFHSWAQLTIKQSGFTDKLWTLTINTTNEEDQTLYVTEPKDIQKLLLSMSLPQNIHDQLRTAQKITAQKKFNSLTKVGLIFLGILSLWKLPLALTYLLAWQIPVEWEETLGHYSASTMLEQTTGVCTSQALVGLVEEITEHLAKADHSSRYKFRVFVLDSKEVNAFALPGGYIFVHRGLIEEAESIHEVAGVLAHELQHVFLRHGIKNMIYQGGIYFMLEILLGGSASNSLIAQAASNLNSLSFSRTQEAEADSHAVKLLVEAGFDPKGLITFFERISQQEGMLPTFLSTHPSSQDRADRLQQIIAEQAPRRISGLSHSWPPTQVACDAEKILDPDAKQPIQFSKRNS